MVAHNRLDGDGMLEHYLRHPEGRLNVDVHDGIAIADGIELPRLVDIPHRATVRQIAHNEGRLLPAGEGPSPGLGRDWIQHHGSLRKAKKMTAKRTADGPAERTGDDEETFKQTTTSRRQTLGLQ